MARQLKDDAAIDEIKGLEDRRYRAMLAGDTTGAGRRAPSRGLKTARPPRSSLSNSRVELFIATKGRRARNARRNPHRITGLAGAFPTAREQSGKSPSRRLFSANAQRASTGLISCPLHAPNRVGLSHLALKGR